MIRSRSKKPAKTKTNKPKKKPIPNSIRTRCLTAMQRLRRLEEANDEGYVRCISCGKVMTWQEAQGGHYIPRTVRTTELDKDNIWPQCPQCNGVRGGNPIAYRYSLVKRIGKERVERLEDLRAAYYGDEEALSRLNAEDAAIVSEKRGKVYYAGRYGEIVDALRAEEARRGIDR